MKQQTGNERLVTALENLPAEVLERAASVAANWSSHCAKSIGAIQQVVREAQNKGTAYLLLRNISYNGDPGLADAIRWTNREFLARIYRDRNGAPIAVEFMGYTPENLVYLNAVMIAGALCDGAPTRDAVAEILKAHILDVLNEYMPIFDVLDIL